MSKPKYKRGKLISSIADFDKSKCTYYKVLFGAREKTLHHGFVKSWQFHMLKDLIRAERVYEAVLIDEEGEQDAKR